MESTQSGASEKQNDHKVVQGGKKQKQSSSGESQKAVKQGGQAATKEARKEYKATK